MNPPLSANTYSVHDRMIRFEPFDHYYAKRIFPIFIPFSYLGLFLAILYLFFDYHTYTGTLHLNGVLASRFVAVFFAVMVLVAAKSRAFSAYRIEAITFFGTIGYTAITYSYIAYDNIIYFVGFNWIFYLVATIMLTPLITKRLYVFMESFQIMAALGLMYLYHKPFEHLFTYTVFSIPLAFYVYAVISLNRKNGLEAYENAYNMHVLSSIDGLSHLLNRRSWYDLSKKLFTQENTITFIMLDIDHFKKINDTHGHDAGDIVIQTVSRILLEQTRQNDLIGRLGGEEFGIILPYTPLSEAHHVAERIRLSIEETNIHYNGVVLNVTVSLGLSQKSPEMKDLSALVNHGDQLLYQAKKSGRNRIAS